VVTLWVVNASPMILLAKVGLVDLLRHLGPALVIPEAAKQEIQRRGPADDPGVQALVQASWLLPVDPGPIPPAVSSLGLGDGESKPWHERRFAVQTSCSLVRRFLGRCRLQGQAVESMRAVCR
jgi:hypothetical protein